jgi:eukaryotic-like serine/threonine-protein kinase
LTGVGSRAGWSDYGSDDETAPANLDLCPTERYERLDLLGLGGMGRVYEVFDRQLQRRVALKEVAPGLAGSAAADRLANEALLTADLDHPGIVSVHDAGRTRDGRLYYTMRLVRGRSLAERLLRADGPSERLALLRHLLDACHAVGYAHSRGVVHRDLKPANIMIGEFGETQVVDWGLARRLTEGELTGSSAGTEGYMSPEAVAGRRTDARSDVWSLGATLHEVVGAGAPPDLAAVIRRALESEPDARYADAHDLAVDVERFLDGRRVGAHDYSPRELLTRLISAWRAPLGVGALAMIVLAVVVVSSWVRTNDARDRAVAAERGTREALELSDLHLVSSLEAQAASAAREGRYAAAEVLAAHALVHRESPVARGVLVGGGAARRPAAAEVFGLPSCDELTLADNQILCRRGDSFQLWGGEALRWQVDGVVSDALAVGDLIAVTRPDLGMELRDRGSGELLATIQDMPGGRGLTATADGRKIGTAAGPRLSVVTLSDLSRWDVEPCGPAGAATALALTPERAFVVCRGAHIASLSPDEAPRVLVRFTAERPEPSVLAWSDGALLAGTVEGQLFALDPADGRLVASVQALPRPVDGIVPLRGTRLVAVWGDRGGVRLWDLQAGVEVMRLPGPTRAAAARGRDLLMVAGADLRRWGLPAQPAPLRIQADGGFSSLATSPDGRLVAASRGDGFVTVWSTEDGRVVAEKRWQDRVVKWVAFTSDGARLLATALGEGGVRSWTTDDWSAAERYPAGPLRRIGALSDGRVWGLGYGTSSASDLRGDPVAFATEAALFDGATTSGGSEAVFLGEQGRVWRLRSGVAVPEILFDRPGARGIAVDRAGRIALAHESHVEVATATGTTLRRLEAEPGGVVDVALSPDGRWAAAGLMHGSALLWSTTDGRLVATLVGHTERVSAVHFTADSRSLTTGDWAGTVLTWSLDDAERPAAELLDEVETTWRMSLEQALAAGR